VLCADPTLCCDIVVTDGQAMLGDLTTALHTCLGYDPDADEECAAPFEVFFGYGQPATAYVDYLTGWLEFLAPDFNQQQRLQSSVHRLPQYLRVNWVFRLSLSGYPTFSSDASIQNPSLDELDRANKVMTSIATVMIVTLAASAPQGCTNLQIERFDPAVGGGDVLGGTAGVTVRVSYAQRF
jgi:hypothetical protein